MTSAARLPRLYGHLWRLALPVLRRNRRLADGWEERMAPDGWANPADVWIQAASGGEAYLAAELLEHLPPSPAAPLRVLLTTWTRQGRDVLDALIARLAAERPDIHAQAAFFPLDEPEMMGRALEMASPRVVVLLETELWPGLLGECAARSIPVLILNGRLSPGSLAGYKQLNRLVPGYWQAVAPRETGALSEEDAARFATLFGKPEHIHVIPNIKFDRARFTPGDAALADLLPRGHRVRLLASVRAEEEKDLAGVIRKLRKICPEDVIIVAPRHLHRVDAWISRLASANIPYVLRTSLTPEVPASPGSVIIWDTFGELANLYALACTVFVGGSLAPLGGQNMLEPLANGRLPLLGPHTKNFSWAMDGADGLAANGLVRSFRNADALAEALSEEPLPPSIVRQRFTTWLDTRRGGTAAGIALLIPYLQTDRTQG